MKISYWFILGCLLWSNSLIAQQRHEVKLEDTLPKLAKLYYNDSEKWIDIFNANKDTVLNIAINPETKLAYDIPNILTHPDSIYAGQLLLLPDVYREGCEIFYSPKFKEEVKTYEESLNWKGFYFDTKPLIGRWEVVNENPYFEVGDYLQLEESGSLLIFNKEKVDYKTVGSWNLEGYGIYFYFSNQEISCIIDESVLQIGKFACYTMDERGEIIDKLEMLKVEDD